MLKPSTTIYRQEQAVNSIRNRAGNLWFRALLTLITVGALGMVLIPVAGPILDGTAQGLTHDAYAHITKSSAFAAYLLLWLSMLAGLSITSKVARKGRGVSASFGLHRYTTLLGLGFAGLHALSLLGDEYMNYTIGQLLVPFTAGSFKPHWLGLGQLALYTMGVISMSFYVRNKMGVRTWRLIHSLSFALFLTALIHGLQSGSDSANWWAQALYWLSAASVVAGGVYRVMAARLARTRANTPAVTQPAPRTPEQRPAPRVLLNRSMLARSGGQPAMEPVRVAVVIRDR